MMIRKLLFVTILVLLTACGEDKNWYVGTWVVDQEYTKAQANSFEEPKKRELYRRIERYKNHRLDFDKGLVRIIDLDVNVEHSSKTGVMMLLDDLVPVDTYEIKLMENLDAIVLLEEGEQEAIIYKGGSRLYYSIDGKAVSDKKPKIFLKKK